MNTLPVLWRVTWQMSLGARGGLHAPLPAMADDLRLVRRLLRDLPIHGTVERVFGHTRLNMRRFGRAAPSDIEARARGLASHVQAFFGSADAAREFQERLKTQTNIQGVQIQGMLTVPVWFHRNGPRSRPGTTSVLDETETPNFGCRQQYLDEPPAAIGARHVAGITGARGEGVDVIDCEFGWNLEHEDVRERLVGLVHGNNDHAEEFKDHGTAVLGIVGGDDNTYGVRGIAPDARMAVAGIAYADGRWNLADAIHQISARLTPGTILLIELQGGGPNWTGSGDFGYVPVEYWQPEFDAITLAVEQGVVVVEAAGNGEQDLDESLYEGRFDSQQRDSGAILVGSGGSGIGPRPRERLGHSNFGSRLDLQGWGEDVVTCGGASSDYGDLWPSQDPCRCYTESFGGTSAASAIVAGVAACVNGALKAQGRQMLDSRAMRQLLRGTGTPQEPQDDGGPPDRIGPLPNLVAALGELGFEV